MRSRSHFACLLLAFAAGAALGRGAPAAGGATPDPDVEFLQEVGVGSGDADLLDYLRLRATGRVDAGRLEQLVRALDSDDLASQERAKAELVRLGPLARERLQRATADKNGKIALQARACLRQLERDIYLDAPRATVRLLVRRRVAGADDVLLLYLPSARDEEEGEQIVYGLDALAVARGRPAPALRTALHDESAARRAAAACIVGRRGNATDQAAVRGLLMDPSPLVRLRAAQGLLAAGDRAGLPALIALLDEPSVALSWQAEELLHWAAWGSAPAEIVGAATPEERRRCRAAWEAWYRQHGAGLDLTKPAAQRRPGLLLVCSHDAEIAKAKSGKVFLYGCDGKPRWKLEGPLFCDAELLPGGRVLLSAVDHITERDLRGQVLWQEKPGPSYKYRFDAVCRRLRNGNTFIGNTRGKAWEFDAKGSEVVFYFDRLGSNGSPPSASCESYPVGDSGLAYLDDHGNLVEADRATGRVRKLFPLGKSLDAELAILDVLPDGHWLLTAYPMVHMPPGGPPQSATWPPQILEVDGTGKVVWGCQAPIAVSATRLHNGNTVACVSTRLLYPPRPMLLEFDSAGRKVWEDQDLGYVRRVRVCLPLVGLGFDRPTAPTVDWDSAERRAKGLKDPDPEKRRRALQFLEELGPKAAPAIPALIEAFDDPDKRVRDNVDSVLYAIGTAAVPAVIEAMGDRRPNVRARAVSTVGGLKFGGAIHQGLNPIVSKVLHALHDENPLVRRAAAGALRHFGSAKEVVVPALIDALKDKDRATSPSEVSVAEIAVGSLQFLGPDARVAVPVLLAMVQADDPGLRRSAILAAGSMARRDKEIIAQVLPTLLRLLKDKKSPSNRLLALGSFYQMGPAARPAVPDLLKALKATDVADAALAKDIRLGVLEVLRGIGPGAKGAIPDLIAVVEDRDRDGRERVSAAMALGGIGPAATGAVPALTNALQEGGKNPSLAQAAEYALRQIRR